MEYETMYKQLKEEAELAMQSKTVDNCLEEFKEAVEKRVKEIHAEIDNAIADALDSGVAAIDCNKTTVVNEDIPKFDTNETFESKTKKVENYMKTLVKKASKVSKIIDKLSNFEGNPYELFKLNKEGKLELKELSKLKLLSSGKKTFDIEWKKVQNQPSMSSLDPNDSTVLNVKGTGCYNNYLLDKEFTNEDEDAFLEFESTVTQDNTYFYFGVINENYVVGSSCMCCTPTDACYLYHSGNVNIHGSYQTESAFEFKSKGSAPTSLKMRLSANSKELYLQVDEKEEKGPYKLRGNKFRVAFGSCNTSRGDIKIVNAIYV